MKATNPRTGQPDYEFRADDAEAVAEEARLLRDRQPEWEAMGPDGRAAILRQAADAVERYAEAITAALDIDTGRSRIAAIEVQSFIASLRKWAQRGPELFATLPEEASASATPGIEIVSAWSAYPLFGAIAPWNFPVILSHIDAVPALMAGCAALVKPSEVTPRFVEPMRAALAEVPDLPLAYVMGGAETGEALVEAVDYVCFTGSTQTGRKVAVAAAERLIPANLELGGKDPLIVMASADPAAAAALALRASVVATGQACQSIERIYVAQQIAEPFLRHLTSQAEAVRTTGEDANGQLGPFIFPPQAQKVAEHIAAAEEEGATVLTGGSVDVHEGGRYLRPTVVTGVTPDMAVMREETFGPVLPVAVFDDIEDAIRQANDTPYGLSAAVFAGSLEEAEAVGRRLNAGAVSLQDAALTSMVGDATNHSRGCSGLGPSRMGDEGMLRFLRRQALMRQTGQPAPLSAFAEGAN